VLVIGGQKRALHCFTQVVSRELGRHFFFFAIQSSRSSSSRSGVCSRQACARRRIPIPDRRVLAAARELLAVGTEAHGSDDG